MAVEDYWNMRPDVCLSALAARLVQCFAGYRVDWFRGCWVWGVVEGVCRGSWFGMSRTAIVGEMETLVET